MNSIPISNVKIRSDWLKLSLCSHTVSSVAVSTFMLWCAAACSVSAVWVTGFYTSSYSNLYCAPVLQRMDATSSNYNVFKVAQIKDFLYESNMSHPDSLIRKFLITKWNWVTHCVSIMFGVCSYKLFLLISLVR